MTTKTAICIAATMLFSIALAPPASSRDAGERSALGTRASSHPFLAAFAAEAETPVAGIALRKGRNCVRTACRDKSDKPTGR